ncbi:pyridoxamine 5'-phosphate oxidase family protein [Spirochaetota bacterium]
MGKLIIPKPNEKERIAFEGAGIKIIETLSEKEFLHMAVKYLNTHNVLHLSTCKNNEPRCTPVEYFNNGLTVYMFCEGGGKVANMKVNPKVSYAISDPYDPGSDFFGASGMQVWGTASIFKKNDDPERFRKIQGYSRYLNELDEQGLTETAEKYNFNVVSIEPVKIRRLCYREGYRNIIWNKDS